MTDMNALFARMHQSLAEALIQKIKDGTATAADLSVARQMLKDNNITAVPVEGSPLQSLTDTLPFTGDEDRIVN
jgi:hypothetical protein